MWIVRTRKQYAGKYYILIALLLCFGYIQMGRGGTLYRSACTLSTIVLVLKKLEISKEALEAALALKHSRAKALSGTSGQV